MASHQQTVSFLTTRFQQAGIRPDTRHGQNFLVDINLLRLLADSGQVTGDDVVLEVGTGTGSLTALVAPRAAAVVTVEIDARLQQLASEELVDQDNVVMLKQDVLRNKNNLHAAVTEAVQQQMAATGAKQFKLVANLPYNVATPIISNLLEAPVVPALMAVTIQKELAERIVARPSTKDYSSLSIWMQSLCDASIVRIMPPTVFWPRPKVESAIIQIIPNEEKRATIPDLSFWHTFVRSLFFHRRKFLRSVLVSAFKGQLEKADIDEILVVQGLGETARAEELDIPTLRQLCEAFRNRLAD